MTSKITKQTLKKSTRKRREVRREEIVQAAIDVFYNYGFHKASLRNISDKLGLTKAAIFYHFPNKEELLFTIVDQATRELLFVLKSSLTNDKDPLENLRNLIINQIHYMKDNMKQVKIMVEDKRFLSGQLLGIIKEQERTMFYLFKSHIEKLQDMGKLKKFDVNTVTFGIFGMINWFEKWYKPNKKLSLRHIADQIVDILLNGLLSQEPRIKS